MALQDHLETIARENYDPLLKGQSYEEDPGYFVFARKAKILGGGRRVREKVRWVDRRYGGSFGRFDNFNMEPKEQYQMPYFTWAYYEEPMLISKIDEALAMGPEQLVDILDEDYTSAREALFMNIMEDFYGTGGGNDLVGLQNLVAASSSTDCGGITVSDTVDPVTGVAWWDNQRDTTTTALSVDDFDTMWMSCKQTSGIKGRLQTPDLILCSEEVYRLIEKMFYQGNTVAAYATVNQPASTTLAKYGFENFKYKSAVITPTSYLNSADGTDGYCFFLNTDTIKMKILRKINMLRTPFVSPYNSFDYSSHLIHSICMTTNSRRHNGVFTALATVE